MKKSLSTIALSALVLSACGGANLVATVDGTEIVESDVEALLYSDGVIPTDRFASELLNTIIEVVVIDAAQSQYGISFSDEEIETQRADFQNQIEGSGQTYEDFLDTQGRTDDWLRRVAHQQLVADAVEEALFAEEGTITDADLQDQYETQLYALTDACVSHILVATEEEAIDAKERIDGGEDFAAVATEVSTDGSAEGGGELGCTALDRYVAEFAQGALDAVIGQTTLPVKSQFGYHLILVTERTTQPFEEVADQMRDQVETLRRGTLLQDWLLAALADADISVVEKYGTWTSSPVPQVIPPQ